MATRKGHPAAPWDRREKESQKTFSYFCVYRDLGPTRTVAKVGGILGLKPECLEPICSKHGWIERTDQWDAFMAGLRDRVLITDAMKEAKQRGQAYSALLGKALQALQHLDVTKANLRDVASAVKVAVEGMRLEKGLATQVINWEMQDATRVIAMLPEPIRQELCGLLEDEARAGELVGVGAGRELGDDGGEVSSRAIGL